MYAMNDESRTMESDSFFRSIPLEYYDDFDGNVEAPTGWFGTVEIDDDFRKVWDGDQMPESVRDGFYLVTIDSNGAVWAEVPVDPEGESLFYMPVTVRANFTELQKQFAEWDSQDEEEL